MNVLDILVPLAIIVPSAMALWLWHRQGELEDLIRELQIDCDGLTAEVEEAAKFRRSDALKIAALRRQLADAGVVPVTVRPEPPKPIPFPSGNGHVAAKDVLRDESRSDDFVNTAVLTSMYPWWAGRKDGDA